MTKIVNGNIMGVQMYGEVTEQDLVNFKALMESLAALRKSLTTLFNEQMAERVMRHLLGDSKVNITDGKVENLEMWEALAREGVVFKSGNAKTLNNTPLIEFL